jgi:hypothetical protein
VKKTLSLRNEPRPGYIDSARAALVRSAEPAKGWY